MHQAIRGHGFQFILYVRMICRTSSSAVPSDLHPGSSGISAISGATDWKSEAEKYPPSKRRSD